MFVSSAVILRKLRWRNSRKISLLREVMIRDGRLEGAVDLLRIHIVSYILSIIQGRAEVMSLAKVATK